MTKHYDSAAKKKIKETMEKWKEGKLKSGSTGKKVKSQQQAVAIGISEARREGDHVPKKK